MESSQEQSSEISNLRALLLQCERELIRRDHELREVHHRIANSLQLASSFLSFQQKSFDDPRFKEAFEKAAHRLTAVARLHHHLHRHSAASRVDLKTFLEELCPEIAISTGMECCITAEPVTVSGEVAQNLAIVINELALNAAKHGYDGQDGGKLKIQCRCDRERLRLTVADGGKGLGSDFNPHGGKGLGMTLVHSIVQQMKGVLEAQDDHGARFILTIPLE
jgi:two-component sensor histidine kinase